MVFSVKTYNNINQIGLKELGNHFQIDGDLAENPDAFIIRSQNLHNTVFPDNLKAIARAGAGTNNIPVDEATEKGIVVFNTPTTVSNWANGLFTISFRMLSGVKVSLSLPSMVIQ